MPNISLLTESERSLVSDSEWRDFHGYESVDEAYSAMIGMRFMEDARKNVKIVLPPNPFSLADDPQWREYHEYKSVEEGRRAILGSIAQECADARGKDVSALQRFLREQWPIYFPNQTATQQSP
ncbi:MAG: hypothetical protein PHH00_03345 [Candidatus Nanoarchaeia archaeon]|nr:hypothetical protein [Candidatus Nanoarchaeia archaeon]